MTSPITGHRTGPNSEQPFDLILAQGHQLIPLLAVVASYQPITGGATCEKQGYRDKYKWLLRAPNRKKARCRPSSQRPTVAGATSMILPVAVFVRPWRFKMDLVVPFARIT